PARRAAAPWRPRPPPPRPGSPRPRPAPPPAPPRPRATPGSARPRRGRRRPRRNRTGERARPNPSDLEEHRLAIPAQADVEDQIGALARSHQRVAPILVDERQNPIAAVRPLLPREIDPGDQPIEQAPSEHRQRQ